MILIMESLKEQIEGTNNLIKCLKRIAFGYRKYNHFIARIFLIKGTIKG